MAPGEQFEKFRRIHKRQLGSIISGYLLVLIFSSPTNGSLAKREVLSIEDVCSAPDDCASCFRAASTCSWCFDDDWNHPGGRCFHEDRSDSPLETSGCKNILSNPMLSNQIPDVIHLEATGKSVYEFKIVPNVDLVLPNIQFKNDKDRPVDLYFLMDQTWTMEASLQTVTRIGEEIATALRNITSEYRLGFGSFVDKPQLPYTLPNFVDNPCAVFNNGESCAPIYSYKHHLSLTRDMENFINTVKASRTSASLDNAESGFDALYQVATCWNSIIDTESRESARKLVLYISDSVQMPHIAGDGKNHPGGRCFHEDRSDSPLENPGCKNILSNPMLSNQIPDVIHLEATGKSVYEFKIVPNVDLVLPNIQFKNDKDRPVDLYFLMDQTWTMEASLQTVTRIGEEIATALRNITSEYRLGFGSFVDKPQLPYTLPNFVDNPCAVFNNGESCAPIYSYKHHLSLTRDMENFINTVKASRTSASLDNAESGFDALYQVATCWNSIIDTESRESARKLVLYISDSVQMPHIAGDGKLGGAVLPLDARCHLGADNVYNTKLGMDYPSVSELDFILAKHDVTPIFATPAPNGRKIFDDLKGVMRDSRPIAANLEEDSKNIVSIIEDLHEEHEVIISPVGLAEKAIVKISVICDCQCNKTVANSTICNKRGDLSCGRCTCHENWEGNYCDCLKGTQTDLSCRDAQGSICSNSGNCICGKCQCTRPFYGKFCELNDRICTETPGGKPCSGHGICHHQQRACQCDDGWRGEFCSCISNTTGCMEPGTGTICSGHGECDCDGSCACHRTSTGWYIGQFCEICPTCAGCGKFTNLMENHVLCFDHELPKSAKASCNPEKEQSTGIVITRADTSTLKDYMKKADLQSRRMCRFSVNVEEVTCYYEFIFIEQTLENQNVTIIFQHTEAGCHRPVPWWRIALPIIASIVLLGLFLILVWKLATYLHVRNEWRHFEAAEKRSINDLGKKIDVNPLYRSPIETFEIPQDFRESKTLNLD
ncbi:unnamed protein product [Notodromas monacha]|uniref:Integrin beta n=1 Tax=Notodromas monacha TaxID=399045 RepID=A0A7R9BT47_9CRUS|nr:unnamed protein product [Notodromas monacha]CAG0921264.1 unnamed protein product [Notodromas monacha]